MLKSAVQVILLVGAITGDSSNSRGRRATVPEGAQMSVTKLLSSGNIAQAQAAARVTPALFSVESYAHFFTVNDEYNSNIFFWYFPVTTGDPDAPLVLWLQGGPGTSSLYGIFTEHGPVSIDANLKPITRDLAWNKKYNILYVDSPVGAGFSYTENEKGYATNMDDFGTNLYAALIQFLALFPDLQIKQFFIAGESYAGKFIPTIGHYIHMNNPTATLKVNLKGIAIGNGFIDPLIMMDYSNHLFQIGLVDDHGKVQVEKLEAEIKSLAAIGEWGKATVAFEDLIQGYPVTPYNSLFTNLTGLVFVYNYLYQNESPSYWIDYVNQQPVKDALHVYDRSFSDGAVVKDYFLTEMMKGVKPWFEELLASGLYRVLIYMGQLDCIVPPKQVYDFTKTLIFPGMIEYKLAKRSKWYVGDMIGGYVKTAGMLTDLTVRNAGHMVPLDQPELAWDLMDRFVYNKSFSDRP